MVRTAGSAKQYGDPKTPRRFVRYIYIYIYKEKLQKKHSWKVVSYFLFSSKLLKVEQSSLKVLILGVCWEGPADPYDETSALQNGNLWGLWGACLPCGLQAGRQGPKGPTFEGKFHLQMGMSTQPTGSTEGLKTHDFPKPVVKSRKKESASWQHWANIFQKGGLRGTAGSAIIQRST